MAEEISVLPWKPRKGAQPGRLRGASPRAAQLRPGHYSERRVPPATREGRPGRTRQDPAGRGARALRLVARRAATATGPSGSPRPPARSPAASLSNLRSLPVSATRHSRPPLQGVTGFLKKTLFPGRADCTQRKVSSPPTFSLRGERSLSGVRGGEVAKGSLSPPSLPRVPLAPPPPTNYWAPTGGSCGLSTRLRSSPSSNHSSPPSGTTLPSAESAGRRA